jgi:hypothetical protein
MNPQEQLAQVSIKTRENLKTIARESAIRDLSHLSLPEIDGVADVVAQLVPAGNVPGVILSGLARLPGRRPPLHNIQRDIHLLFKGVEQTLDKVVYGAFFAGPAAVIWGYQNLLKLAGKDPETSFPEGTWQFYLDYALREDTARHANETHGFDTALRQHNISLSSVDRATAWAMTAIYTLHQYAHLLENEWRERVYISLLKQLAAHLPENSFSKTYSVWEKQRPYGRGRDATSVEDYPQYRRLKFDTFWTQTLEKLDNELKQALLQQIRTAEENELIAYQQQMTILAYLEPTAYGEKRVPIDLANTHIGIIYRGVYYLLPICQADTTQPADVHHIRRQIAAITAQSNTSSASLVSLAEMRRAALGNLQGKWNPRLRDSIDALRFAPILINLDRRSRHLPLSQIRHSERGIGGHALTIFDTDETIIFDQSHIFFDGAWGSALSEIMTNEALSWAVYLMSLPPAPAARIPIQPLTFDFTPADVKLLENAPRVMPEASAETDIIKVRPILSLRNLFKQRSDLLQLTVNDLLVLYRAIHGTTYKPSSALRRELEDLPPNVQQRVLEAITEQKNPVILIPIDASPHSPRDRLHPMTFEVPLSELDFVGLHYDVIEALNAYENATGNRTTYYQQFDALQRQYLAMLAGFGEIMSRAKKIAIEGESMSVGTIKLLAHIPTPLQRLLDEIPGRFEMLNDLIKGREVFSNVGAVVKSSTLTRFISAKDDNDKKTLVWGVITDANGVMRLSLRDFRAHVGILHEAGYPELAQRITQDYLESYAIGLNRYIDDLRRITLTSRETRIQR